MGTDWSTRDTKESSDREYHSWGGYSTLYSRTTWQWKNNDANTQVKIRAWTGAWYDGSASYYGVTSKVQIGYDSNVLAYGRDNDCRHSADTEWITDTDWQETGWIKRTHAEQTIPIYGRSYGEESSDGCGASPCDTGWYRYDFKISALASYTITFDANGGSGAPSKQTKWKGETLTLSSTKPTRANYKFLGWSTSSTATTATYAAGGSYTSDSAATLYAVWEELKVTVKFHVNGGTVVTNTSATTRYRVSSNLVQRSTNSGSTWADMTTVVGATATYADLWNVGTPPITKTGYHIIATQAYALTTSGTGNLFNQDNSATSTANAVTTTRLNSGTQITASTTKTLYVNWKVDTYTVSYNANGGTANSTPAAQTKTYGVTLTLSSTKPTKANVTSNVTVTFNANGGSTTPTSATSVKSITQTFSSWNTKSDGTGTSVTAGGGFSGNGSSNGATITLYAIWANGTTTYSSVTLATGTKASHTLLGWYTVSATTGGTKRGDPGASYTPTGGETLYARWGYNVTYNANGGSVTPTAQVKTPGTALILRAGITKTSTVSKYSIAFDPNGGTVSPTSIEATKTISYTFANWKATDNTTYAASGSYTKDEPTIMTAQWTSTTATAAVTLPTPTWTGRVVDGWYTDTSWTTKRGNAGVNYTPTQSETLYARWKRSVTYNKNTTATVTNLPSIQTAYTDTDIQISNTTPSWTNHNFYKWNTAADGSGTWYNPGQLYSDTNSLDLYAIWKYTITYNANGGTTAPAVHTGTVGQNIKIADEPIYEGYKFTAWTTNADGTGTAYDKGQIYTGQQNLTLYAKWTKINTVEDIQATDVSGGNRFVSASLISNIWNKIAPYFYGKTLYEFNGTIDWNTIRTTPTSNDLNIVLSEACYNYKRLVVVGRTYHNTYVSTVILNPQRNKQFNLNDNFAYHNLTAQEPFSLYMRQVPWTISSDGTKIEQQGIYGQKYLRESTQTAGWNNNFNIKIIKVIGYKN